MGHVNPAVSQPRKDSWRWETTNAEYGKFYVRRNQREIMKSQEFQYDCSKKCEELSNELLEAKAQLEKLKISCVRSICGPVGLQDTACQTSPLIPRHLPSRKLYETENYNKLEEGNVSQMVLDHRKDDNSNLVKCARPKLPPLKLHNGKNNQGDGVDQDKIDVECCKAKMPLGCGVHSGVLGSGSRSSSSGSARDRGPPSAGKRKILQKQGGALKKQKAGSMIKPSSNLKHTAAGGANLPPSQRYTFYRNFGYGGQGAKTSKGWHSKTSPWMPT